MRVLVLSPYPQSLFGVLARHDDVIVPFNDRIDLAFLDAERVDFIVSYGYRRMIKSEIIEKYRGDIINLHISYLPWNKGADPNFWSWIDGTPKGVTIHRIDEGLDTGDILCQRAVTFRSDETLHTSYAKLRACVEELFAENWERSRAGEIAGRPQLGSGSLHQSKDKEALFRALPLGFDTPCSLLANYARIVSDHEQEPFASDLQRR